jgi:hypothetical protein
LLCQGSLASRAAACGNAAVARSQRGRTGAAALQPGVATRSPLRLPLALLRSVRKCRTSTLARTRPRARTPTARTTRHSRTTARTRATTEFYEMETRIETWDVVPLQRAKNGTSSPCIRQKIRRRPLAPKHGASSPCNGRKIGRRRLVVAMHGAPLSKYPVPVVCLRCLRRLRRLRLRRLRWCLLVGVRQPVLLRRGLRLPLRRLLLLSTVRGRRCAVMPPSPTQPRATWGRPLRWGRRRTPKPPRRARAFSSVPLERFAREALQHPAGGGVR